MKMPNVDLWFLHMCTHMCTCTSTHTCIYMDMIMYMYAYYTHMSTHTHKSNDWGCSSVVEYLSSLGKTLYISQLASVWHSGRRGIIYIIYARPFVCVHKIIYKLQVGIFIVLVLCLLKKKIIKNQRDLGRAGASRTNKCVVERLEKEKQNGLGTMKKELEMRGQWVACTATWSCGHIPVHASTKDHVWVHGPTVAGVWVMST